MMIEIIASVRYQVMKPLPTVMRKMFSGTGSRPCPSCVMNGYVTAPINTAIHAFFHHCPRLISLGARPVERRSIISTLKNPMVISMNSGQRATMTASIATITSSSLIMNTCLPDDMPLCTPSVLSSQSIAAATAWELCVVRRWFVSISSTRLAVPSAKLP